MKKIIYVFVILICVISLLYFLLLNKESAPITKEADFVFLGNDTISINFVRDTMYAEGVDPYGVYNRPYGIIQNETIAVEYAKLILVPIYGRDEIESQKPYSVSLHKNSVWSVKGSLKENELGGTFSITINKSDGRVLSIFHSK